MIFLRHLSAAPPHAALDYLSESFAQILDLPAWTVREPQGAVERAMAKDCDEQGEPRVYIVTGCRMPDELLDVFCHAAEKLASDGATSSVTDEQGERLADPVLVIEKWSELGIGINEDGVFHAFTPCPLTGDRIRLGDGVVPNLPGERWPKVLDCLARSDDGTSCRKSQLITELGYMMSGELAAELIENTDELKPDIGRASRTLSSAMADLGRQLRLLIKCDKSQVFTSDSDIYRSGFVVRHLFRDPSRQIRFGQRG